MTDNDNPGAVGASGASAGDMLGGNRSENTAPVRDRQEERASASGK
jgi:hypothetical protein